MTSAAKNDFRSPPMDALRVLAIGLVLVWHAAVPYSRLKLPNMEWLVYDAGGSLVYDILIWACMASAMPLFFFLAGFNAAKLHERDGERGFLANRLTHIVRPFFLLGAVLLPVVYAIWSWGWASGGRATLYEILRVNFRDPGLDHNVLGPGHLWFLEYLIILYAFFLAARRLRLPSPTALALSPLRPFLFALPTAVILYLRPEPFYDFHNSFTPDPYRLAHNGLFFWGGICLYRERERFESAAKGWPAYLPMAALSFGFLIKYFTAHLTAPLEHALRAGLAVSIALTIWSFIFGALGLARSCCRKERRWLRYLSNASFWVYFVHFPMTGLLQIFLADAPLPPSVKFLGALSGSILFGLVSYSWATRYRWAHAVARNKFDGGQNVLKTESAGGVVLNSKGEVLIVNQHGNSWSLPKGHIDPGEDALAAAKREIYEESGISELQLIKPLGSYERHRIGRSGGDDTSELKRMHFFLFKTSQMTLKPVDPHNPEARWVRPSEVAGFLTHEKDKRFFSGIIKELRL